MMTKEKEEKEEKKKVEKEKERERERGRERETKIKGKKEEEIEFWGNNPNILFSSLEIFPLQRMSYSEQLNALTRMILFIGFLLILYYQSYPILFTFIATLSLIYFIYCQKIKKEGFSEKKTTDEMTMDKTMMEETTDEMITDETIRDAKERLTLLDINKKNQIKFQAPSSKNPFSNILLSDKSNKLPAPPISNSKVNNDILYQVKKMVQETNSSQPEIVDKLFKDLDEEMSFEQSLRPFYSTSNTTIPNDQTAFAEFCYGNMISCKEGNLFACARNLSNHYNI